MNSTLVQRKFLKSKIFTIQDNHLEVKTNSAANSTSFQIPFEELLPSQIVREERTDYVLLGISLLLGMFFLANLFNKSNYTGEESPLPILILLFSGFSLSTIFLYFRNKNTIAITTSGGLLEFHHSIPDKETVEQFISLLEEKVNLFLKNKYASIDHDLPVEQQLNNLVWLKDRNILKIEEYEKLKKSLVSRKPTSGSIGF